LKRVFHGVDGVHASAVPIVVAREKGCILVEIRPLKMLTAIRKKHRDVLQA